MQSKVGTPVTLEDLELPIHPPITIPPPSITPDLPPPLVVPEEEEEEEDDNYLGSVVETIGKFESRSPKALKYNNYGNMQYNEGGFVEQFGGEPSGEYYTDAAGFQRQHAKFPDREVGLEAAKKRAKEILKEVKYDPIKFAEKWTGITDPNSPQYDAVINYAKEIDRIFLKDAKPVSLSDLVPLSSTPPQTEPGKAVTLGDLEYSPHKDPSPPVEPKGLFTEIKEGIFSLGSGVPLGLVQGGETYARVADLITGSKSTRMAVDFLSKTSGFWYDDPKDYWDEAAMSGVASTINSLMTGVGGALVGGVASAGPWGAIAGYALSSGTFFTLAEYHRFLDNVVEFAREQKFSEEDVELLRKEAIPDAIVSGVAEGGIEFIQSLVLGKVLGFTGLKKLKKPAKLTLKQMGVDFLKKIGIVSPVEIGGEEVTTMVQHWAAVESNLPQPELWEAMKKTFGASAVQVLLMGVGGQLVSGRYQDTSQNRKLLKKQIMTLIEAKKLDITEDNVDASMVLLDNKAKNLGVNVNDLIGQLFADVNMEDPQQVEDQLLQTMPDNFTTKTKKIVEANFKDVESVNKAIKILKINGVTDGEIEWFGLKEFMEGSLVASGSEVERGPAGIMVSKADILDYLSMVGDQAGIEEEIFSSIQKTFITRQEYDLVKKISSMGWDDISPYEMGTLEAFYYLDKYPWIMDSIAEIKEAAGDITNIDFFSPEGISIVGILKEQKAKALGINLSRMENAGSNITGSPKYFMEYTNKGPTESYTEVVLHVPNSILQKLGKAGFDENGMPVEIPDNFNATIKHFGIGRGDVENVIGFSRVTIRTDDSGKRYMLIEEAQSDIHQMGSTKGYAPWKDSILAGNEKFFIHKDLNGILKEYFTKAYPNMEIGEFSSVYDMMSQLAQLANDGHLPADIDAKVEGMFERLQEIKDMEELPAKLPMADTWLYSVLRRTIVEAIANGVDYVAWNSAENRVRTWGDINIAWKREANGDIVFHKAKGTFKSTDDLISAGIEIGRIENGTPKDELLTDLNIFLKQVGLEDRAKKIYNLMLDSPVKGSVKPLEAFFKFIYDNSIPSIMKKITEEDIVELKNDMYYPGEERTLGVATITETAGDVGPVQAIPITDKVRRKIGKGVNHLMQGEKGSVEFLEDGRAVLRMAQGADASTLFHEIGHIFRRTLSPKQLKEIKEWSGVGEDGIWTRAAEEKFARGFERWLRTGTTEHEDLKETFGNFHKWLSKIYTKIKGSPIDVKLSRDMRNFFDRMFEEPNIESVIEGQKVLMNLGGQYILGDIDNDISMILSLIGSPEFVARNNPEAVKLIRKIIESEFEASGKSAEDYEVFKEAERLALSDIGRMAGKRIVKKLSPERTKKQLSKVRKALEMITAWKSLKDKESVKGKYLDADIKKLMKEQPGVYEAAKILRKYFDSIREDIKDYKKDMFLRTLPAPYANAFGDAILIFGETGDITQKDWDNIVNKHKVSETTLKEYVAGFTEIDNWGIDDYITNMEKGSIRLVDDEGNTIMIAVSRRDAVKKAKEYLEENPDVKTLRLDTSAVHFDPMADLTRIQYWMIYRKLAEGFSENVEHLEKEIKGALGRVVRIKPTHKFAGPLHKREGVLKGEANIFDAVYTYSHVIRKKISVDKVVLDVRNNAGALPTNVRDMLLNQLEYAKGKYSFGDRLVDDLFGRRFGLRPLLFTRGVGRIRKLFANLKLGYRPVASFINFVSGQGHTWVKFGAGYMVRGRQFLKTDKGKDFIAIQERYLGISFAIDVETKNIKRGFKLWQPLGLFSAAELPNRRINVAAAYLYAKDEGMQEAEAYEFARSAVRMIQFTYNLTSLPNIIRSPMGRLVGQFKPYLVKEIEFIKGLKGSGQIMKYFGLQMALAGPRGMLWMIRSIPFFGLLGLWDEIEEWMNKPHPEIPIAGDNIPTLSRGVVGMIGGDITMPATIQLPNRPEDWAGPFLADVIRLYTEVGRPWMEGEIYPEMNAVDWISRLAPATYYWDQLVQSVVDDDGWVRDKRTGNKLYQVTSDWDRALLSMGVSPTKRSEAISAERLFKKEENVRNRNARKILVRFTKLIRDKDDVPKEMLEDLIHLGVNRQTIREAIIRKQLPPKLRMLRDSRKLSRSRLLELYPN